MLRALLVSFAVLALISSPSTAQTASEVACRNQVSSLLPHPHSSSAAGLSSSSNYDEDFSAENELLELINKARELAGVPPLRTEDTLRQAARAHARRIVASNRLEHQFSGEPSLLERIAQVSSPDGAPKSGELKDDELKDGDLRIDRAGENLAYASCAALAHDSLMRSPPHRENLLDGRFNLVGVAAIWSNGRLYVVQDFAREVASYSAQQSAQLVGRAVDDFRQQAQLPELVQLTPPNLDQAACKLAAENRPNARLLATAYDQGKNESRKIVTYTASRPEALPPGAFRLLRDPSLRQFAIGSCYARNSAYPTGMYWVAILLY